MKRTTWPLVATALALSTGLTWGCGGGTPGASVTTWDRAAAAAFTPLAGRIPVMAEQRSQFAAGTLPPQQYSVELGQSQSVFASTLAAAIRLPPYPGQPLVDRLYATTASLYVQAVRCERAALDLPPGRLRDQAMLIAARLRELADRTFDQGRVLTAQGLAPANVPAGTEVVLPAEVPDWAAEGLAAGPPLAPAPPPPDRYPPVRQGARPTEAAGRWSAAVSALHVPGPAQIRLEGADALATTAAGLQRDSDTIGAMADPAVRSGREASVRVRLAILVEAEACRLGQTADLAGPAAAPGFRSLAQELLALAGSFPR